MFPALCILTVYCVILWSHWFDCDYKCLCFIYCFCSLNHSAFILCFWLCSLYNGPDCIPIVCVLLGLPHSSKVSLKPHHSNCIRHLCCWRALRAYLFGFWGQCWEAADGNEKVLGSFLPGLPLFIALFPALLLFDVFSYLSSSLFFLLVLLFFFAFLFIYMYFFALLPSTPLGFSTLSLSPSLSRSRTLS